MSALVQHKDIIDPDIHEPKGASTATVGHAYIADGAGSGSFQPIVVGLNNALFYEVYDTSAQALTGADAIIVMNTEESANAEFTLAAGRITVNFDGRIKISISVSADSTSSTRSVSRSTIHINGVAVTRGFTNGYHRITTAGENTATKQILTNITDGDIVDVRSRILSGSGVTTIANGSNILIERIA